MMLRVCLFNRLYWPNLGATGQLLTDLSLLGSSPIWLLIAVSFWITFHGSWERRGNKF